MGFILSIKFMDILVEVSGNEDVAKELQRYYAKRKLIQITGEEDGKELHPCD